MKLGKVSYNAPVTLGFVIISFVVMVAGFITHGQSTSYLFMTYKDSFGNPLTYVRLITHVFGHTSFLAFIENAIYILLLGPLLENEYGPGKIVKAILCTAAITGVMNYILTPDTALCGASGVVFALIVLSSLVGFSDGEIPLTFILVFVLFVILQLNGVDGFQYDFSRIIPMVGGTIAAFLSI